VDRRLDPELQPGSVGFLPRRCPGSPVQSR
jgi:hypothetical protein